MLRGVVRKIEKNSDIRTLSTMQTLVHLLLWMLLN